MERLPQKPSVKNLLDISAGVKNAVNEKGTVVYFVYDPVVGTGYFTVLKNSDSFQLGRYMTF